MQRKFLKHEDFMMPLEMTHINADIIGNGPEDSEISLQCLHNVEQYSLS